MDFETFVDSLAVNDVPRNVYEAQEIVDHRSVEGDIEYTVLSSRKDEQTVNGGSEWGDRVDDVLGLRSRSG